MTNKLNRESILRMAQGAFEERADKAMAEAISANATNKWRMAKSMPKSAW